MQTVEKRKYSDVSDDDDLDTSDLFNLDDYSSEADSDYEVRFLFVVNNKYYV